MRQLSFAQSVFGPPRRLRCPNTPSDFANALYPSVSRLDLRFAGDRLVCLFFEFLFADAHLTAAVAAGAGTRLKSAMPETLASSTLPWALRVNVTNDCGAAGFGHLTRKVS